MILTCHPDIPGRKYDRPYKFIGYWHAISTDLMTRIGGDFDQYETNFGEHGKFSNIALPMPSDWVVENWDGEEKNAILNYIRNGYEFGAWRGNSWCRFAGCETRHIRGHRDLTDGTYVWAEGFAHYIDVHNVKPPQEFIDHALKELRGE